MSTEDISTEILESLKLSLKEKVYDLLHDLIKELTPTLISRMEEILDSRISEDTTTRNNNIDDQKKIDIEVTRFTNEHVVLLDRKLQERENEYYKHSRCEHMLDLYTECMETEPVYIPRKYHNDTYQ